VQTICECIGFADDAKFYSDEDALSSLVYVPYRMFR